MSNAPLVVGLGELLWDVFPDSRRPGGAPANVAFQANQLGCEGRVASRVGSDPAGDEIVAFLAGKQLDTSLIQIDENHPTGEVTVDLSNKGHPNYTIHENVAWDFLQADDALLSTASKAAAVCFGTLAQRCRRTRETIHAVLSECPDACRIVYDVNFRQQWYDHDWIDRSLRQATIVKLNRDEAHVLHRLFDLDSRDERSFARQLRKRYDLTLVCITRAEQGCLLVTADETADMPGRSVEVVDAVGAGDAFTAALITARLNDWPLENTAQFANTVGGLVASRAGAMPDLKDELAALREQNAP